MATRVVQWKSADGQLFDTEDAADIHDLKQHLIENLLKLADHYDVVFDHDEAAMNMFFDFLNSEKTVLKAYLFPELS